MSKLRFPVLLWKDFAENWTGAFIEQYTGDPAATGKSEREVLIQLKEYMAKSLQRGSWRHPDFIKPELRWFKVRIFPEYKLSDKKYPVDEKINLRIPCVIGEEEDGMKVCSMPTLDHQFYYYEDDGLEELVRHNVFECLNGKTPAEISAYFIQGDFKIKDIVVTEPKEEDIKYPDESVENLSLAATEMATGYIKRRFSSCIEREKEMQTLLTGLENDRASIILAGGSGVGKKTVIAACAAIANRKNKRSYWLSSASRIIAGMKFLGEWEERLETMIEELENENGVFYFEKLIDLIRVGTREPSNSIASFLMPYLQYREVQIVTQATHREIDACRRLLPGFVDMFRIINLDEMDEAKSLSVLSKNAEMKQQAWHIDINEECIELSYSLFKRFIPYRAQPGASLNFINRVFDRQRQRNEKEITLNTIFSEFTAETGLPEIFLKDSLIMNPDDVTNELQKQVIGQDEACRTATDIITSFKAGMNDTERCLATLLFLGPTGVGKTELAKALGRTFFGEKEGAKRIIRLDMSEFSGFDATDRLFGETDSQGSLIDKIRQQPFSIILFDEIEKASPEVFDVLMGLLDEGRLTDRFGRSTWFRSAVVIMTSNLGASASGSISFDDRPSDNYEKALSQFFRTEFINRIDSIIKFHALTKDNVAAITVKELEAFRKREGLINNNIELSWSEDIPAFLAEKGYDERYGARPLQRAIEELFASKISEALVENGNLNVDKIHCVLIDETIEVECTLKKK